RLLRGRRGGLPPSRRTTLCTLVSESPVNKIVLLVALTAALTAGAGPAQATDECKGLCVCVAVPGAWVSVPIGTSVPRPKVEWQLTCPICYIACGLDAELSVRGIDISFIARLGSPVNPGITTARSVVFVASYVGATARAPSFRPHVGCLPARGWGRIPTALRIVKPGQPTVRRVKTLRVRPGAKTVASGCRSGEVLVDASYAFAFGTRQPPSASVTGTVSGARRISGSRVIVSVQGDAQLGRVPGGVQVHAVCSRVRGPSSARSICCRFSFW